MINEMEIDQGVTGYSFYNNYIAGLITEDELVVRLNQFKKRMLSEVISEISCD